MNFFIHYGKEKWNTQPCIKTIFSKWYLLFSRHLFEGCVPMQLAVFITPYDYRGNQNDEKTPAANCWNKSPIRASCASRLGGYCKTKQRPIIFTTIKMWFDTLHSYYRLTEVYCRSRERERVRETERESCSSEGFAYFLPWNGTFTCWHLHA